MKDRKRRKTNPYIIDANMYGKVPLCKCFTADVNLKLLLVGPGVIYGGRETNY